MSGSDLNEAQKEAMLSAASGRPRFDGTKFMEIVSAGPGTPAVATIRALERRGLVTVHRRNDSYSLLGDGSRWWVGRLTDEGRKVRDQLRKEQGMPMGLTPEQFLEAYGPTIKEALWKYQERMQGNITDIHDRGLAAHSKPWAEVMDAFRAQRDKAEEAAQHLQDFLEGAEV